jgi:Acyltransferase
MSEFDDIRPYYDHEVRPTLDRILADPELIHAVTHLTFPKTENWLGWLWRPLVAAKLKSELSSVQNVHGFQQIVEKYMSKMISSRVKSITVSGLDQLDKTKPYLFISNHRDIAMDPAFINWVLYHNDSNTLRIAIGDNLLTKPFASDLMRLNKSFIVNRSAKAPREKLKAAKHLSAYIHHSIVNEHSSIWIAQREGRAKDGCDKTNSAVLGMITLNKPKTESLADYIRALNLVPVSISYEIDPCDSAKARELYLQKTQGSYQKEEHEDVRSIAMGIAGQKGHIHLAFGQQMIADYQDNDQLVAELDQQIINNYVLHATNCFAYEMLFNQIPDVKYSNKQIAYNPSELVEEKKVFIERMQAIPEEHREIALAIYANPVKSKLNPDAQ